MNIFRFIADMLHLSAILMLLYRIYKARNCIGKSLIILVLFPPFLALFHIFIEIGQTLSVQFEGVSKISCIRVTVLWPLTWSVYYVCYRLIMQDARDFPYGFPSTIC